MKVSKEISVMAKVWYEGYCDHSKAAAQRLILAAFDCDATLTLCGWQRSFLIRLQPELADEFAEEARLPSGLIYQSPTRFENGTLVPLYHSPEDEIAARNGTEDT